MDWEATVFVRPVGCIWIGIKHESERLLPEQNARQANSRCQLAAASQPLPVSRYQSVLGQCTCEPPHPHRARQPARRLSGAAPG